MTVAVDLPPQPAAQEPVRSEEEVALNDYLNDRITVEEETAYTASKLARVILCLIFIGIFSLIFCGTVESGSIIAGIFFHFLILFIGYLGAVKRCTCFLITYAVVKIVLLTLLILAIFHVVVSLIVVSFREEKYCRESHCTKKQIEMSELTILQVGLWLIIVIIPATLSFCSVVLAIRLRRLALLGKALQAHDEEALYPGEIHHHNHHHHHATPSPVDSHHHHNHHHHAQPQLVPVPVPVDGHHHSSHHHHHAEPAPVDGHHHSNHHHHHSAAPAPVDGHHHSSHHHHHAGVQLQPVYYIPVQQPGEQGQSLTPTFYYPQFTPQMPAPNAPPAEE